MTGVMVLPKAAIEARVLYMHASPGRPVTNPPTLTHTPSVARCIYLVGKRDAGVCHVAVLLSTLTKRELRVALNLSLARWATRRANLKDFENIVVKY